MIDSNKLRNSLEQCIGTEQYYQRFPFWEFRYTDGVKLFADLAEAHWLINDIFVFCMHKGLYEQDFMAISLIAEKGKADLIFEDGNGTLLMKHHYEFTDAPDGKWDFFWCDKVLMIPSEY